MLAVVACAGALTLSACGGSSNASTSESAGGTTTAAAKDGGGTYKVGYVAALTGFLAPFEEPFRNALNLRVEQLNKDAGADGRQIKLVTSNGKSDPAQGGIVANQLIADGAQFLIDPCDQDAGLPAGQAAQSKSIPVLSACAGATTFPQAVGDFQFLNTPGTYAEGSALAEFAVSKGYKSAYVLSTNDVAYFSTLAKSTSSVFEQQGGKVVGTDNYKYNAPSFKAQTTKIANVNPKPDAVFLLMNPPDSVVALKELAAAGYRGPVLLSFGSDSPLLFQAGDALKDITAYVLTFGFPKEGTPLAAFYEDYKAKYGSAPSSIFAALGADAADLIAAAVDKAGSTDPKAVRDALDGLENVELTSGPRTYKGNGRVPKIEFVVEQARDGRFEAVKTFSPEHVYQP